LAGQIPEVKENFQHILQFEDNQNFNLPLYPTVQVAKRGRPPGKTNQQDSWKMQLPWRGSQTKNLQYHVIQKRLLQEQNLIIKSIWFVVMIVMTNSMMSPNLSG
jgi:hypothetical protein